MTPPLSRGLRSPCGLPAARLSGKPKQKDPENGKALKIRGLRGSKRIYRNFVAVLERHGTPAPRLTFCPSTFSAACPGRVRTLRGLLAALSASLPAVFAAVTVVVLVSLFPAMVEAQGDPEEPCPGGGFNPTPVAVAVTAVPIVVASTTADYFVLYVRHTVDGSEVEFPVLVTLGKAGTTTLAENVAALPKERYRVEKYLIADPADVDGDCIDDPTELTNLGSQNPVNPAAGIALTDGAVAIPDEETFTALKREWSWLYGRQGWTHLVKFFLGDTDTDRPLVYFMNTSKHLGHQSFIDAVGPELGRHTSGALTYHPELVAPDGSQGLYYFSLNNLMLPAFSHAERSYTQLAASMRLLDDNLAVYIPNRWLPYLQSDLQFFRASRMHLVFDEDLFSETDFQALNPGEGFGLLRALDPDERPTPRDVVIYETLPNNLPRVAGIISTVPQSPLSHVNLRAIQDGIPNTFIRDALDKPSITTLIDSYVHYTVTEEDWDLRPATRAEIDAHYESSRPAGPQTPERDLSVTAITPLSEIGFADWKAFGVKAANVAVLGTLDFPAGTVPDGFAIPFYFYDEFMKDNGFYDRIEQMLADPDFQTDFETQDDMLDDLRDDIEDAETPQWIIAAIVEMNEGFSEGINRRYRSSTNNEDLPGFNGAGLYDSKSQKPSEDEDDLAKSLKEVYASLWNFRAFIERDFHRIDHKAAAMGVLVHPSYQDELANGVAVSFDPIYGMDEYYYVNTQLGEDLVTNPDAQSVPEEIRLHRNGNYYYVLATSNQVPPGQLLMSNNQLDQLRRHLTTIHDHFAVLYNPAPDEQFAMEIEFKITSDNILAIKQARPWVFSAASQTTPPPPPPPPPPPRLPGGSGGGGPRQTVPDAPMNLVAEATDAAVTLTWEAPEDDGGSAVTDYEYRINRRNPWISIGSTDTTHTVTGLVNGTAYVFEVRAVNRIGKSFSSTRAEATPEAPEVFTLDFAHFANGTSITSDLVLVNVAPQPVRPVIYFYDTEGAPIAAESVLEVTADLEIQEDGGLTVQTEMDPLGVLTISTHGRGELVSGSVKVVSEGLPIGGGLRYNLPAIGEAVVGASPPVGDALFPVRRQEGGITTGVAIHNLGEEAMEARCELMREGVLRDFVSISLEANGQTSWLIDQAFPAADTSDFTGSVRCTAPGRGRFTAIAVEMDAAERIFNTLSVVPLDRTGGGNKQTTLNFAHFVNGTWITDLVFVNLSSEASRPAPTPFHTDILPSRPAIYFYDTEGNPIAAESVVDITGDLEIAEDGALTVQTEMEPLGVLTISTHGRGELVSGSARVVSDGPIGGMLRFEHPALGVAGVGASPPVSDVLFPVRRQEGGITTGVALHNLESSPGLLRCDLMREGVLRDSASIPLEANGQTSWLIDQAFPAADTSDFTGSVRCDAVGEGLFSAVALEMDPGNRIFTTLPVVPVPEMPDRE